MTSEATPHGFSPELALALACCHPQIEAGQERRIQQIAATPLDWELVTRIATSHGVMLP